MSVSRIINYYGRVFLYLAVSFSSTQISAQVSDQDDAKNLLENLITAFEQKDLTMHEAIWSQSDELHVIGVFENSNFSGWENFRAHLENTFKIAKKIDFTLHDIKISFHNDGNIGWFFMRVDETLELPSKTISLENMRYTGVIGKENGEWRIIQFHGSIPAKSN